MEIVEVSSDFQFNESDLRRFFSFCGEIATIELKFTSSDQFDKYIAELTFQSGTNSALLLDKSTYNGHIISIQLKQQYKEDVAGNQNEEKNSLLDKVKNIPKEVKNISQKYDIWGKTKKGLLFIPNLLMKPCMKKQQIVDEELTKEPEIQ